VKIAPDLNDQEVMDIAAVIQEVGMDGIIISNTTITRPSSLVGGILLIIDTVDKKVIQQFGGLSGRPLKPKALELVRTMYQLTNGNMPIIGCGGIKNGMDAIEYAKAGASAVQLYTALGYMGPGLPVTIKQEVTQYLDSTGQTWSELIGQDVKNKK
jgi:dihydroorotate dehydrogenase